MVGRGRARLLAGGLGLLRRREQHPLHAGALRAGDARRQVVRRRARQLRQAAARRRQRRQDRHPRGRRGRTATPHVLGRAALVGPPRGGLAARTGRATRRTRGRLRAQRPGSGGGVFGLRQHRRGVVELLAGLRRAQRGRPLPPDRAQGADRHRRLHLRRQGLRPPRAGPQNGRRAALGGARRAPARPRRGRGAGRGYPALVAADRARAGARLRVRGHCVRPSAVDRLFLRHHRPAQALRPRPPRRPSRKHCSAAGQPSVWRWMRATSSAGRLANSRKNSAVSSGRNRRSASSTIAISPCSRMRATPCSVRARVPRQSWTLPGRLRSSWVTTASRPGPAPPPTRNCR